MIVQPYLYFDGRCEEAINFYREVLGAKVEMMLRFKENPDPSMCSAENGEKIMHSSLRIGDTSVMASDGRCEGKPKFEGISLSLSVPTEIVAEDLFAKLGQGGQVQLPMVKTFFSPRFGMVADKFGVSWMILVHS
jgi:PhnB protein